jgi:hypothetical protein
LRRGSVGLRRLVLCSSVGPLLGVQALITERAVCWWKARSSKGYRGVWCTSCGSCSGRVCALGRLRECARQRSRPCGCPFGCRRVDNAHLWPWELLPAWKGHEHSRCPWRQTRSPSGSGLASHPGNPHQLHRSYHRRLQAWRTGGLLLGSMALARREPPGPEATTAASRCS